MLSQRANKTRGIVLTEAFDGSSGKSRELKERFVNTDKAQLINHIKDLEKTVSLNKQIITELLSETRSDGPSKKIIEKLNVENSNMQTQLKKIILERNDYQAKLLISEQIIAEFHKKEEELQSEFESNKWELVDQLDRKEFVLQGYERKIHKMEKILQQASTRDPIINNALKTLRISSKITPKIQNIVEENEILKQEIENKDKKNELLIRQLNKLENDKDLPETKPEIVYAENTSDSAKIKQLEQEISRLQKKSEELFQLNVKLSDALQLANQRLEKLGRGKKDHARIRNHSFHKQHGDAKIYTEKDYPLKTQRGPDTQMDYMHRLHLEMKKPVQFEIREQNSQESIDRFDYFLEHLPHKYGQQQLI